MMQKPKGKRYNLYLFIVKFENDRKHCIFVVVVVVWFGFVFWKNG